MGSDHLVWAWGEPLESIRRNFTLGRGGGMSFRASVPWTGDLLQPNSRQLFWAMLWVSFPRYRGKRDTLGPEN